MVSATMAPSTPRTSTICRCSSDCGLHPSSAATTNMTSLTGPTPASMFRMKRSCPGTSTNPISRPESSVVHAKPRSIVRPRRFSSASRSGSIPVSRSTSADFPWSTCPAVATTCSGPAGSEGSEPRREAVMARFRPARARTGWPGPAGRRSPAERFAGRTRARHPPSGRAPAAARA